MEIHLSTCGTFCATCDSAISEDVCFELDIIKALSCDFNLNSGSDSFSLIYRPDKKIFSYEAIEYYRIFKRLKELAQLNNNIKFLLSNDESKNIIHFQHGIKAMLMEDIYDLGLTSGYKPLDIYFEKDNIEVSASMIYAYAADVALSFVSNNRTQDGGTHVKGMIDGIYHAFQEHIKNASIDPKKVKNHPLFFLREEVLGEEYAFNRNLKISKKDVIKGLNFVISVKINRQSKNQMNYFAFSGSTRRELINKDVYTIIKKGVSKSLKAILDLDQSFFYNSRVVQKAEIRNFD